MERMLKNNLSIHTNDVTYRILRRFNTNDHMVPGCWMASEIKPGKPKIITSEIVRGYVKLRFGS